MPGLIPDENAPSEEAPAPSPQVDDSDEKKRGRENSRPSYRSTVVEGQGQPAPGGSNGPRGRSKNRNRKYAEGGARPPANGTSIEPAGIPNGATTWKDVNSFLDSVNNAEFLKPLLKKEGFLEMESLTELAMDKAEFKAEMEKLGVKAGMIQTLYARLRPLVEKARGAEALAEGVGKTA